MSRQKGDIMREVMISIQPKWVEKICRGEKTVEVRKTIPKCETPFKVYIYCTKGRGDCLWRWNGIWYDTQDPNHRPNRLDGKVIGEFICDRIDKGVLRKSEFFDSVNIGYDKTCVSLDEFENYLGAKGVLGEFEFYGWHITDLVVYDEPRELSEFRSYNVRTYIDEKSGLPMPTHEIARPFQSWGYVEAKEPRQTAD